MKPSTVLRILRDHLSQRSLRTNYWAASQLVGRVVTLIRSGNADLVSHFAKDHARFLLGSVCPDAGQNEERIHAALNWLLRAQNVTIDWGFSHGYFPCDEKNGWRSSYPETTGYIIPSLIEYAKRFAAAEVQERAINAALWEVQFQMPNGAVQSGIVRPTEERIPAVVNTGMVLHGFNAAYRSTNDETFIQAGIRAAEFLLGDLDDQGNFHSHGDLVVHHETKTYSSLCAWPLHEIGEDAGERRYKDAAIKVIEYAIKQQQPNGWFAWNCLTDPEAPLLHTICYTLQGILEVGIAAGREDFTAAVERCAKPLLSRRSKTGFLHGRWYPNWEPASFSSCLSGSAQLAVVCYRLFEHTGMTMYRLAADDILNYLKALQSIGSPDQNLNGALGGSFPLFGGYMTAGFPSWAAKYFLDALLLQARARDSGLKGEPTIANAEFENETGHLIC